MDYIVSAIVSTYNNEKFIEGCLRDLLNQTLGDRLEIIVIDSGSEENEGAVVRKFQETHRHIKYIRTEKGKPFIRPGTGASWRQKGNISSMRIRTTGSGKTPMKSCPANLTPTRKSPWFTATS